MDEIFMKRALKEAAIGARADEVPVGAVIVKDGEIISKAHNLKEKKNCSNFHAEMVAIERAAKKLKNWYLEDCEIYVTLEPCAMCAGAIINARLKALYFGAYDPKSGAVSSLYQLLQDKRFNHTVSVTGGVMEGECAALLSEFFKNKRKKHD